MPSGNDGIEKVEEAMTPASASDLASKSFASLSGDAGAGIPPPQLGLSTPHPKTEHGSDEDGISDAAEVEADDASSPEERAQTAGPKNDESVLTPESARDRNEETSADDGASNDTSSAASSLFGGSSSSATTPSRRAPTAKPSAAASGLFGGKTSSQPFAHTRANAGKDSRSDWQPRSSASSLFGKSESHPSLFSRGANSSAVAAGTPIAQTSLFDHGVADGKFHNNQAPQQDNTIVGRAHSQPSRSQGTAHVSSPQQRQHHRQYESQYAHEASQNDVGAQFAADHGSDDDDVWVKKFHQGRPYYVNRITYESVWEKPSRTAPTLQSSRQYEQQQSSFSGRAHDHAAAAFDPTSRYEDGVYEPADRPTTTGVIRPRSSSGAHAGSQEVDFDPTAAYQGGHAQSANGSSVTVTGVIRAKRAVSESVDSHFDPTEAYVRNEAVQPKPQPQHRKLGVFDPNTVQMSASSSVKMSSVRRDANSVVFDPTAAYERSLDTKQPDRMQRPQPSVFDPSQQPQTSFTAQPPTLTRTRESEEDQFDPTAAYSVLNEGSAEGTFSSHQKGEASRQTLSQSSNVSTTQMTASGVHSSTQAMTFDPTAAYADKQVDNPIVAAAPQQPRRVFNPASMLPDGGRPNFPTPGPVRAPTSAVSATGGSGKPQTFFAELPRRKKVQPRPRGGALGTQQSSAPVVGATSGSFFAEPPRRRKSQARPRSGTGITEKLRGRVGSTFDSAGPESTTAKFFAEPKITRKPRERPRGGTASAVQSTPALQQGLSTGHAGASDSHAASQALQRKHEPSRDFDPTGFYSRNTSQPTSKESFFAEPNVTRKLKEPPRGGASSVTESTSAVQQDLPNNDGGNSALHEVSRVLKRTQDAPQDFDPTGFYSRNAPPSTSNANFFVEPEKTRKPTERSRAGISSAPESTPAVQQDLPQDHGGSNSSQEVSQTLQRAQDPSLDFDPTGFYSREVQPSMTDRANAPADEHHEPRGRSQFSNSSMPHGDTSGSSKSYSQSHESPSTHYTGNTNGGGDAEEFFSSAKPNTDTDNNTPFTAQGPSLSDALGTTNNNRRVGSDGIAKEFDPTAAYANSGFNTAVSGVDRSDSDQADVSSEIDDVQSEANDAGSISSTSDVTKSSCEGVSKDWYEMFHEGRPYYVHKVTGESVWEIPESTSTDRAHSESLGTVAEGALAAVKTAAASPGSRRIPQGFTRREMARAIGYTQTGSVASSRATSPRSDQTDEFDRGRDGPFERPAPSYAGHIPQNAMPLQSDTTRERRSNARESELYFASSTLRKYGVLTGQRHGATRKAYTPDQTCRPPHAFCSFGFGGRIVAFTVAAQHDTSASPYGNMNTAGSTNVVSLTNMQSMLTPLVVEQARSFPGPLDPADSNVGVSLKEFVKNAAERLRKLKSDRRSQIIDIQQQLERGEHVPPARVRNLLLPGDPFQEHLWHVLGVYVDSAIDENVRRDEDSRLANLLVQLACQDGSSARKTQQPPAHDQSQWMAPQHRQAQSQGHRAHQMTSDQYRKARRAMSVDFPLPMTPRLAPAQLQHHIQEMEWFVLNGQRRQAIDVALRAKLWDHALLMAVGDATATQNVTSAFLRAQNLSSSSSPLFALYSMQTGVDLSRVADSDASGTTLRDDWLLEVASLIRNKQNAPPTSLVQLAESLRTKSTCASHICYLAAGCDLGRPFLNQQSPPLVLLGSDLGQFGNRTGRTFSTVEAFQSTEIMEWVKKTTTRTAGHSSELTSQDVVLQAYKLMHATYLADIGLLASAQKYLDQLKARVEQCGIDLSGFNPETLHEDRGGTGPKYPNSKPFAPYYLTKLWEFDNRLACGTGQSKSYWRGAAGMLGSAGKSAGKGILKFFGWGKASSKPSTDAQSDTAASTYEAEYASASNWHSTTNASNLQEQPQRTSHAEQFNPSHSSASSFLDGEDHGRPILQMNDTVPGPAAAPAPAPAPKAPAKKKSGWFSGLFSRRNTTEDGRVIHKAIIKDETKARYVNGRWVFGDDDDSNTNEEEAAAGPPPTSSAPPSAVPASASSNPFAASQAGAPPANPFSALRQTTATANPNQLGNHSVPTPSGQGGGPNNSLAAMMAPPSRVGAPAPAAGESLINSLMAPPSRFGAPTPSQQPKPQNSVAIGRGFGAVAEVKAAPRARPVRKPRKPRPKKVLRKAPIARAPVPAVVSTGGMNLDDL